MISRGRKKKCHDTDHVLDYFCGTSTFLVQCLYFFSVICLYQCCVVCLFLISTFLSTKHSRLFWLLYLNQLSSLFVLSCLVLSCLVLFCLVLSCLVLSWFVFAYVKNHLVYFQHIFKTNSC
jgi:hypothetical protein